MNLFPRTPHELPVVEIISGNPPVNDFFVAVCRFLEFLLLTSLSYCRFAKSESKKRGCCLECGVCIVISLTSDISSVSTIKPDPLLDPENRNFVPLVDVLVLLPDLEADATCRSEKCCAAQLLDNPDRVLDARDIASLKLRWCFNILVGTSSGEWENAFGERLFSPALGPKKSVFRQRDFALIHQTIKS